MNRPSGLEANWSDRDLHLLWQDGERAFCKTWRDTSTGGRQEFIAVLPVAEYPTPGSIDRLAHEYGLREFLEPEWAVRPLELVRERGRTMLVLDAPVFVPLDHLRGSTLEVANFLRIAVAISGALAGMQRARLVHKDIKPSHILVDLARDRVWLTGFGIASRLLRERQAPEPPELIAGTLAYMAPEQTGRMNRSIDARSDLYSLGVVLYEMITGTLPFSASTPMEWVHCHIARKPASPTERLPAVPAALSSIIMKLLAKMPEERYQTAAGVAHDLRRCLAAWETDGLLQSFPLGEQDRPDRLVISEKLYGRAKESELLLSSFNQVVATGIPILLLVAGYSGIGKSSVVNELHRVLVPSRGLFASGKLDQYKADVPYATFAQAFQSLVRPLLGKPEHELEEWRIALSEALSPNAALMLELVPELKLIIGEQPAVVDLPAQDAQLRFQRVVRRMIGVFARPEHPLVLFLDDLQWLDPATLDLLAELLSGPNVRHLLLVGAYRDNEVSSLHPLARRLDALRQTDAVVRVVTLQPLTLADLEQLIADALHTTPQRVRALAELVASKTGGNPLFAVQFLDSLVDEGLLAFDHALAEWRWDQARTLAKGYSDNVVELMLRKLARLPKATQETLQHLACLGNAGEVSTLCIVCEKSADQVHADLWEPLLLELIVRTDDAYAFVHDRVQEAAYSLSPEASRAQLHLRIGRLLLLSTPGDRLKEAVFDLVHQLNRASALITAAAERQQLAELNLIAGKRSKAAAAYASALEYLTAGAAALPDDSWQCRHALAFSLELERAECEFLTGNFAAAEQRLAALWARPLDAARRAAVTCLRIDVYVNLGLGADAIAVGLDYLRHQGIEWSPCPTFEEARGEYELMWSRLANRSIEELLDLPLMSDAVSRGTVDVLISLTTPAWLGDPNLLCMVTCRAATLSLSYGNCDGSCVAFSMMAIVSGVQFGDYGAGYRFGLLAYRLVDQRGLRGFQARTYLFFGNLVLPWTRDFHAAREVVRRAHQNAQEVGNLSYAAFCEERTIASMLAAGDPLDDTQRQIETALDFATRRNFFLVILCIVPQLGLVRSLRGLAQEFGSFDDGQTDERQLEAQLADNPLFAVAELFYWVRKLQARFFASDFPAALAAALHAKRLLGPGPGSLEIAEYHFYAALSLAAVCDSIPSDERVGHLAALAEHQRTLAFWAEQGPLNFENRAALVAAEIARLQGRELDAMRLYDRAIRSAELSGLVHNQAVAYEVAGRFYTRLGFDEFARLYLRNARDAYHRWGAHGKVRQLDRLYAHLRDVQQATALGTIASRMDNLDLATVIKVSETIASEIVLEKLISAVMRAALEHAGAERGLLILAREGGYRIEAEAKTRGDAVEVTLHQAEVGVADLPTSVFQYVVRSRESVLLHNAVDHEQFGRDEYVRAQRSRSLLCMPLLKQTALVGLLYLENNLSTDVFTPARISVLELLASAAAVSLENSRLYGDLQEREARMRRLFDSNIIGVFIAALDGQITGANDAFLRIVGYERADLSSGLLRWPELTPPDWREADERGVAEIVATGVTQPYEKEYFRKDGTRVPVLIGCALFDIRRNDGLAFVVDLTDRKRAEEAARQSEQRYLEIQTELSHANRIATVGQLSASIAHEVNQPLSGIITNASTCLRMLAAEPPNIDGARATAQRTIRDATRASDVIVRLRALFTKRDTVSEELNLNLAIREVVALSMAELRSRGVDLRLKLADDLPVVVGDRIQLQQVMLNLIRNAVDSMSTLEDGPKRLLISSEGLDTELSVTVEDSGSGVAAADLERVFDTFYSTKADGLGVGLSICRAIIEAHHGKLTITPATPRGARFQFILPTQNAG